MSSWFGGPASTTHRKGSSYSHSHSHARSPSPKRYFVRSSSSPGAQSTRSAFTSLFTGGGGGKHTSSSSYYRRRPRDGFISRMIRQIKKYLRDLIDYARRNPVKLVLMLVPLVTGGALAGVLKMVGISLPAGLAGMMGASRRRGGVGGGGGLGDAVFDAGGGFGLEQAIGVAKMFM